MQLSFCDRVIEQDLRLPELVSDGIAGQEQRVCSCFRFVARKVGHQVFDGVAGARLLWREIAKLIFYESLRELLIGQ